MKIVDEMIKETIERKPYYKLVNGKWYVWDNKINDYKEDVE